MKKENIKSKILTVSNGITTLRIIGSVVLVFLGYTSPLFIVIYTLTGLTDVLDGWIARLTGTAGKFGATLDSIADLLFYMVMLVKLLPVLLKTLPVEIWYGVAVVLLIRLSAYTTTAIKYHCFASLHTILNKLTGGAVFSYALCGFSVVGKSLRLDSRRYCFYCVIGRTDYSSQPKKLLRRRKNYF